MKTVLPALSALAILAAPIPALAASADSAQPKPASTASPAAGKATMPGDIAPAPPKKITNWEETGMNPADGRSWQSYGFAPQEAMDWHRAGFEPVVARTWSDKGFDPEEAQEWRDSARQSRTMMSEMDHADSAAWKREGFSPSDRLAWWEAGFVFDDAALLARAGMTPAQAAWHGHDKLRELRNGQSAASPVVKPDGTVVQPASAPAEPQAVSLRSIWNVVGPFLKVGLVGMLTLLFGGFAFFLYRRAQTNGRNTRIEPDDNAPDSELPPGEALPQGPSALQKRKPAREVRLFRRANPHCIHCKSTNVRASRMHPHKFARINFTEYFRCRQCGRHFAIVSYTPILLVGGGVALALMLLTTSIIYILSVG